MKFFLVITSLVAVTTAQFGQSFGRFSSRDDSPEDRFDNSRDNFFRGNNRLRDSSDDSRGNSFRFNTFRGSRRNSIEDSREHFGIGGFRSNSFRNRDSNSIEDSFEIRNRNNFRSHFGNNNNKNNRRRFFDSDEFIGKNGQILRKLDSPESFEIRNSFRSHLGNNNNKNNKNKNNNNKNNNNKNNRRRFFDSDEFIGKNGQILRKLDSPESFEIRNSFRSHFGNNNNKNNKNKNNNNNNNKNNRRRFFDSDEFIGKNGQIFRKLDDSPEDFFVTHRQPVRNNFQTTRTQNNIGRNRIQNNVGRNRLQNNVGSNRVQHNVGRNRIQNNVGTNRIKNNFGSNRNQNNVGTTRLQHNVGSTSSFGTANRQSKGRFGNNRNIITRFDDSHSDESFFRTRNPFKPKVTPARISFGTGRRNNFQRNRDSPESIEIIRNNIRIDTSDERFGINRNTFTGRSNNRHSKPSIFSRFDDSPEDHFGRKVNTFKSGFSNNFLDSHSIEDDFNVFVSQPRTTSHQNRGTHSHFTNRNQFKTSTSFGSALPRKNIKVGTPAKVVSKKPGSFQFSSPIGQRRTNLPPVKKQSLPKKRKPTSSFKFNKPVGKPIERTKPKPAVKKGRTSFNKINSNPFSTATKAGITGFKWPGDHISGYYVSMSTNNRPVTSYFVRLDN